MALCSFSYFELSEQRNQQRIKETWIQHFFFQLFCSSSCSAIAKIDFTMKSDNFAHIFQLQFGVWEVCLQLEVNNLMSQGRSCFEPNGSGLSQVYMHMLAFNSWIGLGWLVLVCWASDWFGGMRKWVAATSGSSAPVNPPIHCTGRSQVGAAARFGPTSTRTGSSLLQLGPPDRCNWHPIHSQHLPNPIQFANTARLIKPHKTILREALRGIIYGIPPPLVF